MFAFAPFRDTLPEFAEKWFPNFELLDHVGFTEFGIARDDAELLAKGKLAWLKEIEFDVPGLSTVSVAVLAKDGMTQVGFEQRMAPNFELTLKQLAVAFRIKTQLLQRVKWANGQWVPDLDGKGNPKRPELVVTPGDVRIDSDYDIEFVSPPTVGFPPVKLAGTGIVLEVKEAALWLSSKLPNAPEPGFKGVTIEKAAIHFTGNMAAAVPDSVALTNVRIGSSGFSGRIEAVWGGTSLSVDVGTAKLLAVASDDGEAGTGSGSGSGTLFGIPFAIESLMVEFRQNAPVDSSIKGTLTLPFFEAPVRVEVRYGLDGGLLVRLDSATGDPLRTLEKENLLRFELESLGFALDDGVFTAQLSGQLTPLFQAGTIHWPSFEVRDLSIDSEGRVKLAGGWLNIPDQKFLDFHGFKIEISQLGFGRNPNGSKWVGFSGGLKLVQGLQAGASVEGLRITWFEGDPDSARITLNGAGVELAIPGVLELKGEVSYREITTDNNEVIRRFDGDITLRLETPQLAIDGTVVIGSVSGGVEGRYNFFAVYVDVELPTGIPLGATGLGIYGFAGLFALRMEPDKRPEEAWFSIDKTKSFYHRAKPGITDLKKKWVPRKGSFALGAGLTLATYADNGYTFNGKFLLALVIPGPIILLQGAASFLTKRGEGEAGEGMFRALAVYDGRGGSVTIGLDAEYKTGKGGEMIEIGGSMEAFYAFDDPSAWHLWLGRDSPREQRIRALFGRFVEANAYFMLDAHELALGAWFGYANRWGFGPLGVTLEAWAEGNARISFRPGHFHGDVWMHCLVELNAFGFGLGLSLDARLAADLFRPYHLIAELSVGIKLPRPFKKRLEAQVRLEWGPRPDVPPLPLPLVQVAIEHEKSTAVWPIARGQHLLPVWDDGEGFIATPGAAAQPDLAQLPLAPLDARIALTFGRSVHDDAAVGVNSQQIHPPYEVIGDPKSPGTAVAAARYSLEELELSRWNGGSWTTVAKSPQVPQYPRLFGAWAATPALPDGGSPPRAGQSKLTLWAETPYVFTRSTGAAWEEWVSDGMGPYPCPPVLPATETCFGFESLIPGTELASPWTHPTGAFTLSWGFGPAHVVETAASREGLRLRVLCFPRAATARGVHVEWARPARSFRILLWEETQVRESLFMADLPREAVVTTERICADLTTRIAGTHPNPLALEGVRFTVRGADGSLLRQARIERWGGSPLGIDAGHRLDLELPCPASWVELVVTRRAPCRIAAYDGSGAVVATHTPSPQSGEPVTETIRLTGEAITRLELFSGGCEKLVHSVCYACPKPTGPAAEGTDGEGNTYGPFVPGEGGEIHGEGEEVTEVTVTSPAAFCIRGICVTPDPQAGQGMHREELIRHIEEQFSLWRSSGPVLEPDSFYRLAITTSVEIAPGARVSISGRTPVEYAYFRTEGPPGITTLPPPPGVDAGRFDSGLDDLVRYVEQTDPPTVPPAGEKPVLYKPFYRAYDLGTEFNESYVEQMYRAGGRDLGLYVFDNGNRPARDAKGRLLVLGTRWGTADTVTLTEKDEHWVTLVDRATCIGTKLDPATAARSSTLVSADPGRVLAPDTLHEARLIPLLLHETFADATPPGLPGGWLAEDAGGNGPSAWQSGEQGDPPARFVEQLAPVGETTLLLGTSAAWTDYRLSVYVRASAGEIGVVVRRGPGTGYRFTLGERIRRLVKLADGAAAPLAQDHFAYQRNRDYRLTFEVLGDTLRTYVDGEPAFEVTDTALAIGGIGLYTASASGARFTDVAVDDLRRTAPVAYRFQLTTSRYANFFHHFHSFDDRVWRASLGADDVASLLAQAVTPSFDPPQEDEARAFEALAEKTLQAAARQHAERLEITRVERDVGGPLLLLRGPEPLDPRRVQLGLRRSALPLPEGTAPAVVKLADAEVGAGSPSQETVSLLLREATELTRHRLELREVPWLLDEAEGDPIVFLETFADARARDRFTTNEPPHPGAPSTWQVESGALVELSGSGGGSEPELPGMHATTGEETWLDYRVTALLRGDAAGELGILLRYTDEDNYYRLSAGAALRYRRLVKCVAGVTTVLWEDSRGYAAGEPFRLALQAVGSRLMGCCDDEPLFDLHDTTHAAGRAGVYAAANFGARCEEFEVRHPSLEARALFTDRFDRGDVAGWTFVDGAGGTVAVTPPGALTGFELGIENGAGIAGDPAWDDTIVQARVRTDGGAAGVMVRSDATGATCYRFSISGAGWRLEKLIGGTGTVLWSDAAAAEPDRAYELTLGALGATIRGFVDGAAVFAVDDADIEAGQIGLHSEGAGNFAMVSAWEGASAFGGWLLDERFGAELPEEWTFAGDGDGWQVNQGWLGVAADEPARHYALATSPAAGEFRLSARLRIDVAAASGILFAWRDAEHHDALWVSESTVRFTRVEGEVATTLASAPMALAAGRDYLVTVEHVGGRLSAAIDGVPLLAVDTFESAGTFGFAVDAGPAATGAGFRELRVAVPRWTALYAFGAEERLPAGKVVRVHSGAVVTLDPLETPVEARSAAVTGERGRIRFPADGVLLRVVTPGGDGGHVRSFLPRSAFEDVDFDVLRKADGTAAFLVPRLQLPDDTRTLVLGGIFHRNRAATGRPMSQAGNRSEERAGLSFPFV
jgi:hypothetical protein